MFKQKWEAYVPQQTRSSINAAAGAAGISAAMTLIMAIIEDPFALLDVLIISGLGLGIWLKKSRVCAVVLLVYFAFGKIIQFAEIGIPGISGLLVAFAFISAYVVGIKGTFEYQKLKKDDERIVND